MEKLGKVLNLDPDPLAKLLLTGLKPLSFVPCHMEENVDSFLNKKKACQGLLFAQITLQKCTTNFDSFVIKTKIANL